jgi:hypothetical protein
MDYGPTGHLFGDLRQIRRAKRHLLWRVFSAYQASDAVHLWRTWGVTLGVQGVVACGGMWRLPGGGSVRS